MKNTAKRKIQILFVLLVALATLAGLAACGSKVTAISIGRNDMPRVTYVEGQDLDLSAGKLTVEYSDKKIETVALGDKDVAISGYNKSTVGAQTVTVTYQETTTTFNVTVIARVAVENAQTVYYVGEQMDTSRGRLVIANDDATTFQVPLSDATVSFQGFNSASPASSQTITVNYRSGNANYSGSFNVAIYTTDNAKLTPPNKVSYRSHEEFRVNGAYITYSNGNSSYDKSIPVTMDMVSGIDFTAVNESNSPLVQKGVVTYGGKEYEFNVTITYSEVTRLQNLLTEYAFTWNESTIPTVSQTEGERAVECANIYLNLSSTESAFIDKTAIESAVRIATVYSYRCWQDSLQSCENSFTIREGNLYYRLASYAAAKADYTTVTESSSILNAETDFLIEIMEPFQNLPIGGEQLALYLSDINIYVENKTDIAELLSYAASVYEALESVPGRLDDLSPYATQINQARDLIVNSEYGSSVNRDVYTLISSWRENDDYFDILYSYYLQNADDRESIAALKEIVLPSKLNELYVDLISSILEYSDIYIGTEGGVSSDATFFMYYYRSAKARYAELQALDDSLYQQLYETLTFDHVLATEQGDPLPSTFDDIFNFIESTQAGYYDFFAPILDNAEILALWDTYLELLTETPTDEIPAKMKEWLNQFAALSPAEQKDFLLSVNVYYYEYGKLSLDTDLNYTYLIRILKSYFGDLLSEEEFGMFRNLLLAIESYASASESDTAVTDFITYLANVKTAYDSTENKTVFQEYFDDIYNSYLAIAALYDTEGVLKEEFAVDAEWQAVFDALINEINGMFFAYSEIAPEEGVTAEYVYIRLFASYESARGIVNRILTTAPDSVKAAYYHKRVLFFEEYQWTLDYAMTVQAMGLGVMNYTDLVFMNRVLWDVVKDKQDFRAFVGQSAPVVWTQSTTTETITVEQAVGIMESYLTLSYEDKVIFNLFQSIQEGHEYYYEGLSAIFNLAFGAQSGMAMAADALLDFENGMVAYFAYTEIPDFIELTAEEMQEFLLELQGLSDAFENAYADLSEAEQVQFSEYFGAIMSAYRDAYSLIVLPPV